MEGANIVKLHRFSGKVSYLFYPDFDTAAHPVLLRSLKVSLRALQLDCYDYATASNPPILHRKEAFLPEDYPQYQTFAVLTQQEEEMRPSGRHLDDRNAGWLAVTAPRGGNGSRGASAGPRGMKRRHAVLRDHVRS